MAHKYVQCKRTLARNPYHQLHRGMLRPSVFASPKVCSDLLTCVTTSFLAKAFTAPLSTLCTASHRDRGAAQEARAREGAPAAAGGPPSAPSPAGPPLPSPAELRTWPLDNKFVFLGVETGFHACRAAKWMILLCTLALGATPELRGMSTLVGKFAICLQLHLVQSAPAMVRPSARTGF